MGLKTSLAAAAGAVALMVGLFAGDNVASLAMVDALDAALDRLQGAEKYNLNNPFTKGPWAPVDSRSVLGMAVISGALPEGLGGAFLRIGPNPGLGPPSRKRYHPFDGDGMLHVVRFKHGNALYSNAMMLTRRYIIEQELGMEYFPRVLGELSGFLGLAKAILVLSTAKKQKKHGLKPGLDDSVANTHTVFFDGDLFALQESTLPFEFAIGDDSSITSVGFSNFDGALDVLGVSAHPHVDERTQQMLWHGYSQGQPNVPPFMLGIRTAGKQAPDFYQPINLTRASFNHDMAFTQNYAVILDQSLVFAFDKMVSGDGLLGFDEKHKLRIGLLSRSATTDETMWFQGDEALGIVHPFAAWEDGDEVVFWAPAFTEFRPGSTFEFEPGAPFVEPASSRITEFRMNLKDPTRRIRTYTVPCERSVEFSKINSQFFGYPTRYGYGGWQAFHGDTVKPMGGVGFNFRGVVKIDFEEKKIAGGITFPDGCVGGDPSYIPRAGSQVEDDGWLAVVIYDTATDETFLYLYSATSLENVAVLAFPARVPPGFHSNYITENQFQQHLRKQGAAT